MGNWFSKRKFGNTTITTSAKGVTVSTSSGVKGYRVTNTVKTGAKSKMYQTTTQRSGGLTRRTRKTYK